MPLAAHLLVAVLLALSLPVAAAQDVRGFERAALGKEWRPARDAIEALAKLGAEGVPALTKIAERGLPLARLTALKELARLGTAARPALGVIEKLAGAPRAVDGGDFVHAIAVHGAELVGASFVFGFHRGLLSKGGAMDETIGDVEVPLIRDAFGGIAVLDVADGLERLAKDKRRARSIATVYDDLLVALGHAVREAKAPPVDAITSLLAHDDAAVRQSAALLLAALGPRANAASERLLAMAADTDRAVAARAVEALGAVGADLGRVRPVLEPLRAERGAVGRHATCTLALLAGDDRELRAGLVDLAKNSDVSTRRLAAAGLGRIGPQGAELTALGKLLADRDETVRSAAVDSIHDLGAAARELLPEVERRIRNEKVQWLVERLESTKRKLEQN